ncbi:hypothetical protein EGR_10440 [Echinococcus granulosus]|uniref:Uncharacterized protein n=1 Tax=Echinococcus granulosus TaxID=6210 RepID=W6U0Q4_ECHGR|nr:hypothetical protein EGR_10440 [Echinococcus granulosus]EUB54700.1 hypothetical protein EGR_10440 [Echinococcus granulosus]
MLRNVGSTQRAFLDCPPNKVATRVIVQFRHGVRPPALPGKLYDAKTYSLGQLVKLTTKKRQEPWATPIFQRPHNWSKSTSSHRASPRYIPRLGEPSFSLSCLLPNGFHPHMRVSGEHKGRSCSFLLDCGATKSIVNLQAFPILCNKVEFLSPSAKLRSTEEIAWDVILGADFLSNTKAVLNFAEGTFSTHEATGVNTDTSPPKDDADDICNALFETPAIPMSNLDDLCVELTHIPNDERKELRQPLLKYANIFSWQGASIRLVPVKLGPSNSHPDVSHLL